MDKALHEMSLEELWQLFPIFLVPYQSEWESWYACEEKKICSFLPSETVKRIAHIGSTAVPGIWAKNIVDILLEVKEREQLLAAKNVLSRNGWTCMSEAKSRISMNKGYTPNGFASRVFHLHIRLPGDHDELYFRDYLCENAGTAKEYEVLKLSLWKAYEHDRDGYTKAKSGFVQTYTAIAKQRYQNRY